jgi:DNA modification methylase
MEKVTIGNAELYCGDCAVILPQIESVDLILTDPPYGLRMFGVDSCHHRQNKATRGVKAAVGNYGPADWDMCPPDMSLIEQVIQKGVNAIVFGGNYFGLPAARCWLVWDKDNSGNYADCELAWTTLNHPVRKIKWRWNGMIQEDMKNKEQRVHPTQKPLRVMEWCITKAPDDVVTICDPFMGSGTTGVAAMNLERQFIGIERERKYFDIACERIDAAQAQGRLAI